MNRSIPQPLKTREMDEPHSCTRVSIMNQLSQSEEDFVVVVRVV
jgi:hypothetical protein